MASLKKVKQNRDLPQSQPANEVMEKLTSARIHKKSASLRIYKIVNQNIK